MNPIKKDRRNDKISVRQPLAPKRDASFTAQDTFISSCPKARICGSAHTSGPCPGSRSSYLRVFPPPLLSRGAVTYMRFRPGYSCVTAPVSHRILAAGFSHCSLLFSFFRSKHGRTLEPISPGNRTL
jgi:hypothetical protein